MKRVTILGLHGTTSSIVTGPMDIFYYAGRLWNSLFEEEITPYFKVEIVTSDGNPFACEGDLIIHAHGSIHTVEETDLLIIPSISNLEEIKSRDNEIFPWIKKIVSRGAHIAAICTGTFVLAETGLLDGKIATTHWGVAEIFRALYPNVLLKPERMITESGSIFTAGGSNACFDISLFLVRKYCGHDVARKLAKTFLHDLDRVSQAPWIEFQCQRSHTDKEILRVQERLESQYSHSFTFDELAREFGMSRRTFERRFKSITGDSPLQYLQRVRVEAAKRILESENRSFDEITYVVGYEDPHSFRKVFSQVAGISPSAYRRKWHTPMDFAVSLN